MKRSFVVLLTVLIILLGCSGSQTAVKSSYSQDKIVFAVLPLSVQPAGVEGSAKAASLIQKALIEKISQTKNQVIKPDVVAAKMKELNISASNLDREQVVKVGKALKADVGVFGVLDYRKGPESEKTEENFMVRIVAVDIKTGNEVWETRTGRIFNWNLDPEKSAKEIAASFVSEIIYSAR